MLLAALRHFSRGSAVTITNHFSLSGLSDKDRVLHLPSWRPANTPPYSLVRKSYATPRPHVDVEDGGATRDYLILLNTRRRTSDIRKEEERAAATLKNARGNDFSLLTTGGGRGVCQ